MNKTQTKLVAGILIFIMMFTYLSTIGKVIASSLEAQTSQTKNENVEFDAYFMEDEQKVHSASKTIGEENYLYAKLTVKNAGYLKNTSISLENANFEIMEGTLTEEIAKTEKNKIELNQINNGKTIEAKIPIQMLKTEIIPVENFAKQSIVKLTGTYIDGNGKEKRIEKEITLKLEWTATKEAELNVQISKFVPYNMQEKKGVLLQTIVQSNLKNNTLPVKTSKIELQVPNINGVKPEQVKVTANTTKQTTGEEVAKTFNSENYEYNAETGKLTINVNNKQESLSWKSQAKDEFVVTYIFPTEVTIPQEGAKIIINANSELTVQEANEAKVTKEFTGEITLKDQISNLVDFNLETNVTSISKGQIYANYNTENKIETIYKETVSANVGLAELIDKIELTLNADNFKLATGTKNVASDTYYKELKISKANFEKMLGEEGFIKIWNGETLILSLDKTLEANTEENLVINLAEYNINSLKIETSKPLVEGKLELTLTKAIKGNTAYTIDKMKATSSLELNVNGVALNGETKFIEQNVVKEINFTEPTLQAELAIDNNRLSTIVTNQNVKITAILKTDSLDCNLYKNPTLQITLPKYVEKIDIKNIEVLFDTEGTKLTYTKHNIVENADGTKTIQISLEGTQTEYMLGAVSKGVNVVITLDITANKLTPNKQENIKMVYTNNNATTRTLEAKEVLAEVNFVAPTGVVTTNGISNYAENAQILTSISGEEKTATIEILAGARNAKFEMNVINNYNNTIDNITILGRTPFKGNKKLTENTNLGSTITMPLVSGINLNGVDTNKAKIYYSENGEATKDLNLATNGWVEKPTNIANVKSYMIILNDHTMNAGDIINFSYEAQIPANLEHNESAFENYVVYFNNNLQTGSINDKQDAVKVGVTTGKGPVLETNIISNIAENTEVATDKFIKYTASVTNKGEEVAKEVVLKAKIPNRTTYIEFATGEAGLYKTNTELKEVVYEIGNLKPGEKVSKSFWVRVDQVEVEDFCTEETHYVQGTDGNKYHDITITHPTKDYKLVVSATAAVTAKDLAKEITSNEAKNTIKNSHFFVATSTTMNGLEKLREGDEFNYYIQVHSYDSQTELKNVTAKVVIPEGLTYESAKIEYYNSETDNTEEITNGIQYNEKTKTVTISLGNLENSYQKKIIINSKVDKLGEKEYKKIISNKVTVSAEGIEPEDSNEIIDTIAKEAIEITQTCTIPNGSKIEAGEKFSYKFTISNIGGTLAEVKLEDVLPEQLQYSYTEYKINGETKRISSSTNNKVTLNISLPEGTKMDVEIVVVAKEIAENTTISNKATISSKSISNMQTNEITHTVLKAEVPEEGNNNETVTRKISGQVWLDENKNAIKEETESFVADVKVLLYNNMSNELLQKDGKVVEQITDKTGNYTFENVPKGSYTVIFLYDTANYSATTYRKEGVYEEINSDAIDSKITLDGVTLVAGITEAINIDTNNIYNIDLGLITNPKFDLKLDKVVSKITVKDNKGTNVYDYKDSKLAKRDLIGKQINETTAIVEYKITVTNEGAVPGYVKKIVDYMPTEMKFSSELNRDWYTGKNGEIYNASLASTIINPGESKEVTLLLTKKLSEDNLEIIHNTAEIYEAYNDLGLEDIDSEPKNKVSNEDDISSADVLFTVKTGEVLLFVGLTTSILIILGVGAYFIKKKVLR